MLTKAIKMQARITWSERDKCYYAMVGHIIACRGSLSKCEMYCQTAGYPIRNKDEVNRIKYQNMPVSEMFC